MKSKFVLLVAILMSKALSASAQESFCPGVAENIVSNFSPSQQTYDQNYAPSIYAAFVEEYNDEIANYGCPFTVQTAPAYYAQVEQNLMAGQEQAQLNYCQSLESQIDQCEAAGILILYGPVQQYQEAESCFLLRNQYANYGCN